MFEAIKEFYKKRKWTYVYKERQRYIEGQSYTDYYEQYRFNELGKYQSLEAIGHEGAWEWVKLNPQEIGIIKSMIIKVNGRLVVRRPNSGEE
jgi:hypothetical protein